MDPDVDIVGRRVAGLRVPRNVLVRREVDVGEL